MKRLSTAFGNNWVVGISTGLIVWLLTSGLMPRLDRTTIALSLVFAALAGAAAWLARDDLTVRARLEEVLAAPVFDTATGFYFERADTAHACPLCPDCMSRDRSMSLRRGDYGWECPSRSCQFFRGDEDSDRSVATGRTVSDPRSL